MWTFLPSTELFLGKDLYLLQTSQGRRISYKQTHTMADCMSSLAKDCEYDCDDAYKSVMLSTNDNPPNSLMNDFSLHDINVTTRRIRSVADTASRETCTPSEDNILAMLETMNN